jgi:hypothetical protein
MTITTENFPKERNRTREFSNHLQTRLADHFMIAAAQFRPSAGLGEAVSPGAKDAPKDWPAAYAKFRKRFDEIASSLSLQPTLPDVIELNSARPVLCPFVYDYKFANSGEQKRVRVKNGLRFVLSYPDYPYEELLGLVGVLERKPKLREFVLHYAALNFVVTHNRRLLCLFEDMNLPISTENVDGLAALPITTITAPVTMVRPPDDVIAQICEYSGSNTIEEVADLDVRAHDPLGQAFGRNTGTRTA